MEKLVDVNVGNWGNGEMESRGNGKRELGNGNIVKLKVGTWQSETGKVISRKDGNVGNRKTEMWKYGKWKREYWRKG